MKGNFERLLPSLLLLCATLLIGCGGGTTKTTGVSGSIRTTGTNEQPPPRSGGVGQIQASTGTRPRPYAGPLPTDPEPLPNQGTSAAAGGVPTVEGGDNSVQTYGVEGQRADRLRVTTLLAAYFDALSRRRWSLACTYLTARLRSRLAALPKPDQMPRTCANGIALLLGRAPSALLRSEADVHVLSFRVRGSRGFVIYRDGRGKAANVLMLRAAGTWKVDMLLGNGLPV